MKRAISVNDLDQPINRNLYKYEGKYYRLFAKGVTDNYCWLIAPEMRELLDINIATGKDVYGSDKLVFDGVTGTFPYGPEYIKY